MKIFGTQFANIELNLCGARVDEEDD